MSGKDLKINSRSYLTSSLRRLISNLLAQISIKSYGIWYAKLGVGRSGPSLFELYGAQKS